MDITQIFKEVLTQGASDLHLSVGLPPIIRIQGKLTRLGETPLTQDNILSALKVMFPQQEFSSLSAKDIDLGGEIEGLVRFRCHLYNDYNGLCVAFRLIPYEIKSLQELGLPDVVDKACTLQTGLVMVTGPAGAGKTTTLAALIDKINSTRSCHIVTLEDPIEFLHRHKQSVVNQMQVGIHTASFSEGLRNALREDPDVILVGEMRDLETIKLAITAAETGHLVFATLHTRDTAQSVDRIVDVFPSNQQEQVRVQLADSLQMVISQMLIPGVDNDKRYVACEILVATMAIRRLIREKKGHQIKSSLESGGQLGMQTFESAVKNLAREGKIAHMIAEQYLTGLTDSKKF
jgi:twitching motility protein PilT